jgi:hypothetical protein
MRLVCAACAVKRRWPTAYNDAPLFDNPNGKQRVGRRIEACSHGLSFLAATLFTLRDFLPGVSSDCNARGSSSAVA